MMDKNTETKKYFLKNVELTSIEQDSLNMADIVENVQNIIDTEDKPISIAITGKSGSGKSSLINFITNKYKEDENNFKVEKFNVWKESKTVKEYLNERFREQEEGAELDELIQFAKNKSTEYSHNSEVQTDKFKENTLDKNNSLPIAIILKICNAILTFVVCFFVTTLIFIAMEYWQNAEFYRTNDIFFVENTYLNYMDDFGFIMLFSFLLTAVVLAVKKLFAIKNHFFEKSNIKPVNKENRYVDLDVVEEENFLNKTNIIVIEDLDKLPLSKMLKALEDIKYVGKYKNCVFIVPLDMEIVKNAIKARNTLKASASNYRPMSYEKIIDKIFQYKIPVTHITNGELKEYGINRVRDELPDFALKYCNLNRFKNIIANILVYKDVDTPRQVKNNINNFVNNRMLASARIRDGKIDEQSVDYRKFDFQLAKISVLQSDFTDFYNLLFKNSSYLDRFTELCMLNKQQLKERLEDIDDEFKPFLTAKYASLRRFLRATRNCTIENVTTLLYFTTVKEEKIYKGKLISSYIDGNESISEFKLDEISAMINVIGDDEEMLSDFVNNNFDVLLQEYENNSSDSEYLDKFNDIMKSVRSYISEEDYEQYLLAVAENYENYPQESMKVLNEVNTEMPDEVMETLFPKLKKNLSVNNYDEIFDFVKRNSDYFYEENRDVSEYVSFLVEYIYMSSNPDDVIEELDENFNRIGKVYELNRNIKGIENINLDKACTFMAKCLDNGDLVRMIYVMNAILSDKDSVEDCLNIEEKMVNYSLIDVVEGDVDYMKAADGNGIQTESNIESDELDEEQIAELENLKKVAIENGNIIKKNITLLKNLLEVCAKIQEEIQPADVLDIFAKALEAVEDDNGICEVYDIMNKFDRAYFYDIRRDLNNIIYDSFHNSKNNQVKKHALECTRHFRNTHLFIARLTKEEKVFYNEN